MPTQHASNLLVLQLYDTLPQSLHFPIIFLIGPVLSQISRKIKYCVECTTGTYNNGYRQTWKRISFSSFQTPELLPTALITLEMKHGIRQFCLASNIDRQAGTN